MAKNVLGGDLEDCNRDPMTGFFRDGKCNTCAEDAGMHTVCAVMTEEFLEFSKSRGNDLSSPIPMYDFPGLKEGDRWCLCLPRWLEALEYDMAPQLVLKSTHMSAIEHIDLDIMKQYAVDADELD